MVGEGVGGGRGQEPSFEPGVAARGQVDDDLRQTEIRLDVVFEEVLEEVEETSEGRVLELQKPVRGRNRQTFGGVGVLVWPRKLEELDGARMRLQNVPVVMKVLLVRGLEILKRGQRLSEGEDLVHFHLVSADRS